MKLSERKNSEEKLRFLLAEIVNEQTLREKLSELLDYTAKVAINNFYGDLFFKGYLGDLPAWKLTKIRDKIISEIKRLL